MMHRMIFMLVAAVLLAGCAAQGGANRGDIPQLTGAGADLLSKQQFVTADGEAARSEALFQSLLRKLPNDSDTWFRLGNLYAANNRPEPAANAYTRALLSDNSNVRAWHNLGVVRLREAYAALIQAQMTVDSGDALLAQRIETLVTELGKVSVLSDQARAGINAPAPIQEKPQ